MMKIIRIISYGLPNGCADCTLHITQESVPSDYCAALKTKDYNAAISYEMYDYRRHDCPLDIVSERSGADNPVRSEEIT